MSGAPEPIKKIVEHGEILDAMQTAAVYAFGRPDTKRTKADVWLVRTATHLGLAAATDDRSWSVFVDAKEDAEVKSGLTRDTVRVGPYTIDLRRRSRAGIEGIVKAFSDAASGTPYEAASPAEGAALEHALGIPEWWSGVVGGDEPWWRAIPTATTYPLFDFEGHVRDAPIFVGFSRTKIVVAAHDERAPAFVTEIEGEAKVSSRFGKDDVHIGEWRFSAKDEHAERIAALANTTDQARLELLVARAFDVDDLDAAASYATVLGDAETWRKIALRRAENSDLTAARAAVASAIGIGETARDHVNAAAWAWRDGDAESAQTAFATALGLGLSRGTEDDDLERLAALVLDAPPPEAPQETGLLARARGLFTKRTSAGAPEDALVAFSETATKAGFSNEAAALLVRREQEQPSDRDEVGEIAQHCKDVLGAPRSGAIILELHARRIEEGDATETAKLWLDAAALRAEAGDTDAALSDLFAALASEFLRPEHYQTALATPNLDLPPDVAAWWRHLASVLGEDDRTSGTDPIAKLEPTQLDELHPGGTGWLDGLRHAIQEAEPPPRATLVRGLERLNGDREPLATRLLSELADALGIPPPDAFLYRGDDAFGVCVWPIAEPVLLLGYAHLDGGPRKLSEAALRFLLAVELTHLACRHPLLSFETDFLGTSHSVYQTFGKYAGTAETVVDIVTLVPGVDQVAKLQHVIRISRRVFNTKSAVDKVSGLAAPIAKLFSSEDAGGGIGRDQLEGAALQFRLQADRAALLLTGDLDAAVEAILLSGPDHVHLPTARDKGLAALLGEGVLTTADELRLTSLAGFAAQQRLSQGNGIVTPT